MNYQANVNSYLVIMNEFLLEHKASPDWERTLAFVLDDVEADAAEANYYFLVPNLKIRKVDLWLLRLNHCFTGNSFG